MGVGRPPRPQRAGQPARRSSRDASRVAVCGRVARPTKADLEAARNKTLPDVIAPDLAILFCGINPGLYTAAIGCHFGRPGNRFWPVLHRAGFTPRLFSPFEQRELLTLGYGITNLVPRATATADELTPEELLKGAKALEKNVRRYAPGYLAIVGVGAYRTAFGRPKAKLGLQEGTIASTKIWVLPNPSGLNANYQAAELVELFRALATAARRS